MQEIKRVLWIDDYLNNRVSDIFPDVETKKVSTLDDAIKEISGERLYDYDTIVLDIDFENGLINPDKVISQLSQRIYLSKDQKNKNFIINNGGYLLYLYLLEKGYPSERIAFLTGNVGIIEQLKTYNRQNIEQLSKNDIANEFIKAWNQSNDDIDMCVEYIKALPIHKLYRDEDFVLDCMELIEKQDIEGLNKLIEDVNPPMVTGSIQNTGDMMIFRFHEANLESPVYFSKNDNDIEGHNRKDVVNWLNNRRTPERLFRWLVLRAGEYVEKLWRDNASDMTMQIRKILWMHNDDNLNYDMGIRNAFRQMYYVFDGLKAVEYAGAYYQAMAAMLIPFEANVTEGGAGDQDLKIRRRIARCAKQARNYSAHNYFGTTIKDQNALFILMIVMSAVLNKAQRSDFSIWYEEAKKEIIGNSIIPAAPDLVKLEQIINHLWAAPSKINVYQCKVTKNVVDYTAWDYLCVFGWNDNMRTDTSNRESYYIFSLAAYMVKLLSDKADEDIEKEYGIEIKHMYDISKVIVENYSYPL